MITITCNRLELTRRFLHELKKNSDVSFRHVVVDNGSTDGTLDYLKLESDVDYIISLRENVGILKAWQIGIRKSLLLFPDTEYFVKFDNDCEILTENTLGKIIKFFDSGCKSRVIAPYDIAIPNELLPRIIRKEKEHGHDCMYVEHSGGIFQVMPKEAAEILITERDNTKIGGDLLRGRNWIKCGYDMIYLTDLKIKHQGIGKQTKNYKLA